MLNKNCKKCWSKETKKDWFKRWKQRYKCKNCGYVFQNKSRTRNRDVIWKDFSEWKQTYKQLSHQYWVSISSIQKQLDQVLVKKKIKSQEM